MRKRRVASPLSRRVRRVARPHTGLWRLRYARYPGSRLRSGNPAAQVAVRLVLLGSPPDTVHGAALRGTDPSSLLTWVRRHNAVPGAGIHPCCSGLQVQGTANSPTSAALRGTDPSSLLTWVRRHIAVPGAGIHPCCSGLQVQGTANSPTSEALPRAGRIRAVPGRLVLLSYIIFARLSILFFDFLKSAGERAGPPPPRKTGGECRPGAALPSSGFTVTRPWTRAQCPPAPGRY